VKSSLLEFITDLIRSVVNIEAKSDKLIKALLYVVIPCNGSFTCSGKPSGSKAAMMSRQQFSVFCSEK
jgi:hypothetical protein